MNIWYVKNGEPDAVAAVTLGDVIITKSAQGYSFYIVLEDGMKCVETVDSLKIIACLSGAHMVFSMQPLAERHGDKKVLYALSEVFRNELLRNFIINAIDILSYKTDMWDAHNISAIYLMPTKENGASPCNQQKFTDYLPTNLKELSRNLVEQGKSRQEALKIIKEKNHKDFISAYSLFKKDHPEKTIIEE